MISVLNVETKLEQASIFQNWIKEEQTAEKKLLSSMFGKQNISNVSYLREQRAALRER